MKNPLIIITLLFSITFVFAQEQLVIETRGGVLSAKSLAVGSVIRNPPNNVVGSVFLFDEWENKNYVHLISATNAEETIKLNNINVNVQLNKFTTKIDNNQIFSFNQDYFNYVIIENRRFEYLLDANSNIKNIFEIIGVFRDKKLVKGYSTFVITGKASGYQTSAPVDKIKIKSQYFIYENDQLVKIKLKKKDLLAFMKDKKEAIITYVKKEKLSYKKEKDVRAIFRYYNSL